MTVEFLPFSKRLVVGFLKGQEASERSTIHKIIKCLFFQNLGKSTILIVQAGTKEAGHLRKRVDTLADRLF